VTLLTPVLLTDPLHLSLHWLHLPQRRAKPRQCLEEPQAWQGGVGMGMCTDFCHLSMTRGFQDLHLGKQNSQPARIEISWL